jgi:pullulanase
MMRTKKGVENSFESPDSINLIDWEWKSRYIETADFVKALIEMRKTHPAFRIPKAQTIREHLRFIDHPDENVLVYKLDGAAVNDSWRHIMVIFNGSPFDQGVALPPVNWTIAVNVDSAHQRDWGPSQRTPCWSRHSPPSSCSHRTICRNRLVATKRVEFSK